MPSTATHTSIVLDFAKFVDELRASCRSSLEEGDPEMLQLIQEMIPGWVCYFTDAATSCDTVHLTGTVNNGDWSEDLRLAIMQVLQQYRHRNTAGNIIWLETSDGVRSQLA